MSVSSIDHGKHQGIEMLRVFITVWLIAFHYYNKGNYNLVSAKFDFDWLIASIALLGGGLANNVFVLITGYLLSRKTFSTKRILKIWGEVWLYSVLISCFCFLSGLTDFTRIGYYEEIFPILLSKYWFATTYIALCLLFPFINILLDMLDLRQHLTLIAILFIILSLLPTITGNTMLQSSLLLFILLYCIGAAVHKYSLKGIKLKNGNLFAAAAIGSIIVLSEILFKIGSHADTFTYFSWGFDKSTIMLMSIFIFLTFINMSPSTPPTRKNQVSGS